MRRLFLSGVAFAAFALTLVTTLLLRGNADPVASQTSGGGMAKSSVVSGGVAPVESSAPSAVPPQPPAPPPKQIKTSLPGKGSATEAFDAGNSFQTPHGTRRLLQVPGVFALRIAAADEQAVIAELTQAGGPMIDYQRIARLSDDITLIRAREEERERLASDPAASAAVLQRGRERLSPVAVNPVFVDPESGIEMMVTGELLVRLKPGVDPATYFGANLASVRPLGGTVDQFYLRLADATAEQQFAEVNRLMSDPQVEWAEPNLLQIAMRHYTPNDSLFSNQWHLHNTGQRGGKPTPNVDAPAAWDQGTGTGAIVAVLDDGVPDLPPGPFPQSVGKRGRDCRQRNRRRW